MSDLADVETFVKANRALHRAAVIASTEDAPKLSSAIEILAKCHTDVRVFLTDSLPHNFELDTELTNITVSFLPLFMSPVTLHELQLIITHAPAAASSTIVHAPENAGGIRHEDLRAISLQLAVILNTLAGGAFQAFALGPRPRAIVGLMRDVAAEVAARCESDDSTHRPAHLLLLDRDADLVGPCRIASSDPLLYRALWALPPGPGPEPAFHSPFDPARAPDSGSILPSSPPRSPRSAALLDAVTRKPAAEGLAVLRDQLRHAAGGPPGGAAEEEGEAERRILDAGGRAAWQMRGAMEASRMAAEVAETVGQWGEAGSRVERYVTSAKVVEQVPTRCGRPARDSVRVVPGKGGGGAVCVWGQGSGAREAATHKHASTLTQPHSHPRTPALTE